MEIEAEVEVGVEVRVGVGVRVGVEVKIVVEVEVEIEIDIDVEVEAALQEKAEMKLAETKNRRREMKTDTDASPFPKDTSSPFYQNANGNGFINTQNICSSDGNVALFYSRTQVKHRESSELLIGCVSSFGACKMQRNHNRSVIQVDCHSVCGCVPFYLCVCLSLFVFFSVFVLSDRCFGHNHAILG